jgi:type I restriction enzyme M protein
MQANDIHIITVPEGKIRDYIDGKFRNDTPEEYVRQNIEKRLVGEHGYPKTIIKVEHGIKVGSSNKRVDIALFPEDCKNFIQENINIIIECKKDSVKPSDKKEGVEQLKSYMSASLNCEWGMWTNGQEKEVLRKVSANKFEEYIDIPSFRADIEDIDRPKRNQQKKAIGDNLLFAFRKCHNVIYANEGMQKQPAFFELLKLIFCKIEDEKNILEDIQFYVTSKERNNQDGQLTAKKRITKIFDKVKIKYNQIFATNEVLELSPRTIAGVVGELQKYSLLDTAIDVKGRAYEEIVGSNLRGDRGEFFTPRNVMTMAVKMVNPRPNERVLDSSCGTGGFLVNAMNHVITQIKDQCTKQFGKEERLWNDFDKQRVRDIIADVAKQNFFGFDINPDLVKATKMNMVMNNDGSGNILRENSLLPPHEWNSDFKSTLAKALGIEITDLTHHSKIGFFDVIVTNPPFGSKIPIDDSHILSQFDIAKRSKSMPPEQVFIERCVQLLKPNGRLAIVLPDSILGAPGLIDIRKWLLKYTRIVASIDLHQDTFQPFTGVQTSVLVVQKKTVEELNEPNFNYPIFMAMIEKVGHDKRGNPTLKRDKDGEIIYYSKTRLMDNGDIENYEETELDDQTTLVPDIFTKWKKEEGLTW